MANFPEIFQLERFFFGKVGLLNISGISESMPMLEVLDLAENKIFETGFGYITYENFN